MGGFTGTVFALALFSRTNYQDGSGASQSLATASVAHSQGLIRHGFIQGHDAAKTVHLPFIVWKDQQHPLSMQRPP
jgi:hypothetical protein